VDTDEGLVVTTHLWWTSTGPVEDPYAPDPELVHENRARVLALPGLVRVVPGHGPAFAPSGDTPR
jgi:glyoxylase-like metal-dependent hydrolase (beta-lactamase superfamily II)